MLDSGAHFLMRTCGTNVFAWSQSFLGAWAALEFATLLKNGGFNHTGIQVLEFVQRVPSRVLTLGRTHDCIELHS